MTCRGRCEVHAVHKPMRALSYVIGGQRFKIVRAADDLSVHVLHGERDAEDVRSGAGDRAGNRNIGVASAAITRYSTVQVVGRRRSYSQRRSAQDHRVDPSVRTYVRLDRPPRGTPQSVPFKSCDLLPGEAL
jgi:hypothetical protein